MCSLDVSEIIHLNQRELYISDMQLHDATRDIVMINQLKLCQIKHTLVNSNHLNVENYCKRYHTNFASFHCYE